MVFLFSPFSPFSPFSRFRRFRVHRLIPPVFAFSGFRVFVFTGAFTCSVLAFSCYRMDCFGTYFTHAQSCDNVRVHSATEWTASVHTLRMPKAVITFVFIVVRNGLLRYIPYRHAQSCDNVRVHSATQWTASVHTLGMPKAVITFVFKVLRNGLLRYIPYACPKL